MALHLLNHEHPLLSSEDLIIDPDARCFGCGEVIPAPDPSYGCRDCKIRLHKACGDLPIEKSHPFHQDHPLRLVVTDRQESSLVCNFCSVTCFRLAYRCSSCDLTLDVKCATSPKFSTGSFPEHPHFAHDHPLISVETHTNEAKKLLCLGCEEPLLGPICSCVKCVFHLHRKCLDLPLQISHPCHRKHPLLLLACRAGKCIICDVCQERCLGFVYNCHFCDFDVHVKCVSPQPIMEGATHEHPFTLLLRSVEFSCDVCGMENKGAPYVCTKCNLVVHKNCTSFPHSIKVWLHHHALSCSFPIPNDEPRSWGCEICGGEVSSRYVSYNCLPCGFVAHVGCATKKYVWDKEFEFDQEEDNKQVVGSSTSASALTTLAEHELVFSEVQNEGPCCFACGESVSGPRYSCGDCSIQLHRKCAELPLKIDHPFHSERPLKLVVNRGDFICRLCFKKCNGFAYQPSCCQLILDVKCATSKKFTVGIFPKFKNFSHQHTLISIESHTDEAAKQICFGCRKALFGPIYSCLDCNFHLHSKCFDPLTKISHPSHRKHQLCLLVVYSDPDGKLMCGICSKLCKGFAYGCVTCDFQIHSACASELRVIESKIHEHPFTLFSRRVEFLCNSCGKTGDGTPYVCIKCSLVVHKDCALLPRLVNISWHSHPLSHTYSILQGNELRKWECPICLSEVNTREGSYCCCDCDYVVHISCAMIRDLRDLSTELGKKKLKQQLGDSNSSASQQKPEICENNFVDVGTELSRRPPSMKHCSHEHELSISREIVDADVQCNGCAVQVSGSLYYHCSERCDFFLHEACAFAPHKIENWVHWHPLELRCDYEGVFRCLCCACPSSGFSYHCPCGGSFCLRCRRISNKVEHPAHDHPLLFQWDHKGECHACGRHHCKMRPVMKCKDCDFEVDFRCLTLPTTARHRADEHPLVLTYGENEDDPWRCWCYICEERRHPKHWFYWCRECDFKAHTRCVLGKYPFIRIGNDFNSKSHSHSTLKIFKLDDYPSCHVCSEPITDDVALKCNQSSCNYMAHGECISKGLVLGECTDECLKY